MQKQTQQHPIGGSYFSQAPSLQNELNARAIIAADLYRDGEITRTECFRVEMDAWGIG